MPARQNIIVVIPRDWAMVRGVLARLQSLIDEWIGSPSILSVQDFSTGSTVDRGIVGVVTEDNLLEPSEDQILALYPHDPKRGAVLALHEGAYDLIVLAVGVHGSAVDRLERIWSLIGDQAYAVLVGEELEVEDNQIATLLRSGKLPPELDLCEAAIVGFLPSGPKVGEQELPYGGHLLLR